MRNWEKRLKALEEVMSQSELRQWLDDEQLVQYKGPIAYSEVFVICYRLIHEIERRRNL